MSENEIAGTQPSVTKMTSKEKSKSSQPAEAAPAKMTMAERLEEGILKKMQ